MVRFFLKINSDYGFSRNSAEKEVLDKDVPNFLCSVQILSKDSEMKVSNSLKTLKKRDRNNRVIRRRGRTYVINKKNPRMKARQG